MRRRCPSCGELSLPFYGKGRKLLRECSSCNVIFKERFRPRVISEFAVVCTTVGMAMLSYAILANFITQLAGEWVTYSIVAVLALFIGGALPAYLLNRTVLLAPVIATNGIALQNSPSAKSRYLIVVVVIGSMAALALRGCVEIVLPKEMSDLAEVRETLLPTFVEVLKKYKSENICYPKELGELVPNYIAMIPAPLDPGKTWKHPNSAIRYSVSGCNARFHWLRCNGPDCASSFEVESGDFWHAR